MTRNWVMAAIAMALLIMASGPADAKKRKSMKPAKPAVAAPPAPVSIAYPAYAQSLLQAHNAARTAVKAPPLSWDPVLADDAMVWAKHLAATSKFEHDSQAGRNPRQGENLWMGTKGAYSHAEMAASWVDEKQYFRAGTFPKVSSTGNWADVGHYTQVIWKNTTSMGCAIASNASDDYLVCRYAPAGNVLGQTVP